MDSVRVLIADDHPVFLKGLTMLINMKQKAIKVVHSVADGKQAVSTIMDSPVDVALLDIKMPEMDGVAAAKRIKELNPRIKIIMLTTFDDRDLVIGALKAGASGYILKDAPVDKIVQAIVMAHEGNVLIAPKVAEVLGKTSVSDEEYSRERLEQDKINSLTDREQEVLLLLAHGMANPDIAEKLNLSEHTVRNYVSHIYDAIGVRSRTEAIFWARKFGIA